MTDMPGRAAGSRGPRRTLSTGSNCRSHCAVGPGQIEPGRAGPGRAGSRWTGSQGGALGPDRAGRPGALGRMPAEQPGQAGARPPDAHGMCRAGCAGGQLGRVRRVPAG
jgi:hypothetical protein